MTEVKLVWGNEKKKLLRKYDRRYPELLTPGESVKFLKMLQQAFLFKTQVIQTDNGTEFTYKYIIDDILCPFDTALDMYKS